MATMKKSNWKINNWDKWTFWHKFRHVIAVVLALEVAVGMCIAFLYMTLALFGLAGFINHIRDTILVGLMHIVFG